MSASTEPNGEMKGLTRFHKLTVGCGVLFSFLVAYRFIELWRRDGGVRPIATAAGFAVGGILLALYLRHFLKKGI